MTSQWIDKKVIALFIAFWTHTGGDGSNRLGAGQEINTYSVSFKALQYSSVAILSYFDYVWPVMEQWAMHQAREVLKVASPALMGDKAFMIKVVEIAPRLTRIACPSCLRTAMSFSQQLRRACPTGQTSLLAPTPWSRGIRT